jgi:hypothetical protein
VLQDYFTQPYFIGVFFPFPGHNSMIFNAIPFHQAFSEKFGSIFVRHIGTNFVGNWHRLQTGSGIIFNGLYNLSEFYAF